MIEKRKFINVDLACGQSTSQLGIIRFVVNAPAWEELMGQGVPMMSAYIRDLFKNLGFSTENFNQFTNDGVVSVRNDNASIEFTYEVLDSAIAFEGLVNYFCKELTKRGFSYTITNAIHNKANMLTCAEIQLP